MDKYYYFVAQLPVLFFDKESDLALETFLQEAQKWLGAGDFRILSASVLNNISGGENAPEVLKTYSAFEEALQHDIARWRQAHRASQEYKPLSFPLSIIKEGNPLEVEKKLLALRWHFLNDLETGHHFDVEFLILYFIKLQILHRLAKFNKEKGLRVFQSLCDVT